MIPIIAPSGPSTNAAVMQAISIKRRVTGSRLLKCTGGYLGKAKGTER